MKPHLLILLTAILTACSTTPTDAPGGYVGTSRYYWVTNGVRYATDGTRAYYLVHPQFDGGSIGGSPVGTPEEWREVGGSSVRRYLRNDWSMTHLDVVPQFSQW